MEAGPKRYYPVFLDLEGRTVVVVGCDEEARRKAVALARYGADVVMICPDPSDELVELEGDGTITLEARPYVRGDLRDAFLVATSGLDEETARAVFAEADGSGCLISTAGVVGLSNFIVPGTVRRGPLQIAVSTGGTAPAAAKVVRRAIKEQFDDAWGEWVGLLGRVHALAVERLDSARERADLLERVAASGLEERIRAGERLDADTVLEEFGVTAKPAPSDDESGESLGSPEVPE